MTIKLPISLIRFWFHARQSQTGVVTGPNENRRRRRNRQKGFGNWKWDAAKWIESCSRGKSGLDTSFQENGYLESNGTEEQICVKERYTDRIQFEVTNWIKSHTYFLARKTTVLRCLDEKEFKSSYSKRPIRQDIWSVNRSFPLNKLPLLVTPTCVLPYATAWWGRGLCMLSRDFWKETFSCNLPQPWLTCSDEHVLEA